MRIYETWTVWRHIKNINMSADDSFSSDSDNSLHDPINEIESGKENSHEDHIGVRPYRFEPGRTERVASVGDNAAQDTQNSVQVREEDDLSWFVFIMTKRLSK